MTQHAGVCLGDRAFWAEEAEWVKLKAKERERGEAGDAALEGGELAGLSPEGPEGLLKVLHKENMLRSMPPALLPHHPSPGLSLNKPAEIQGPRQGCWGLMQWKWGREDELQGSLRGSHTLKTLKSPSPLACGHWI